MGVGRTTSSQSEKKQFVFFCQAVMDPAGPVGASEVRRAGGLVAEFIALKESAARQSWCQQKHLVDRRLAEWESWYVAEFMDLE